MRCRIYLIIQPPASITGLQNTTYFVDRINWTWTDPGSTDFNHVMVYLDGIFQTNVTRSDQEYTALSLDPGTQYTIATQTEAG